MDLRKRTAQGTSRAPIGLTCNFFLSNRVLKVPDDEDDPVAYLAYVLFVLVVIVAVAATSIFFFVGSR